MATGQRSLPAGPSLIFVSVIFSLTRYGMTLFDASRSILPPARLAKSLRADEEQVKRRLTEESDAKTTSALLYLLTIHKTGID